MEFLRLLTLEHRGVSGHTKTLRLSRFYRADRELEDTFAANQAVMSLFQPVQVDTEGQIGGWLEFMQSAFQKDGVGAEVYELFTLRQLGDDLGHLGVHQGFPSRD